MKNKPALYLTSKDTLICSDHVQVVEHEHEHEQVSMNKLPCSGDGNKHAKGLSSKILVLLY